MLGSKFWLAPVVLGVLAVLAGAGMVVVGWHHTVGLGVIASAAPLFFLGAGMSGKMRLWSAVKGAQNRRVTSAVRVLVVLFLVLVIAFAAVASASYVVSLVNRGSQRTLSLSVNSSNEVAYPNGTIGIHFVVVAHGGSPPYVFSAFWQDGVVQSSSAGSFYRNFAPGQSIVTGVNIAASGVGKELGSLYLTLPSQALEFFPGGGQGSPGVVSYTSVTQTSTSAGGSISVSSSSATTTGTITSATITTATTSSFTFETSSAGSATANQGYSFTITIEVLNAAHQPVPGATVTIDGGNSQTTSGSGAVVYDGVSLGSHVVRVVSGTYSYSSPLVLSPASPQAESMFVTLS